MSGALEVTATGAAADAVRRHVPALAADGFAGKLFAEDATLWGAEAESEAKVRLSWVGLHRSSRPLLGQIPAIRAELGEDGVDHVVLCGMGGSSLAPEVICATAGVELTVLDSSHPDQVRGTTSRSRSPFTSIRLSQTRVQAHYNTGISPDTLGSEKSHSCSGPGAVLRPTSSPGQNSGRGRSQAPQLRPPG